MTEYEILSLLGALNELVKSAWKSPDHFYVAAPEYVNKKFTKEDGTCLDYYVIMKELDRLIDMLVETDMPVDEVLKRHGTYAEMESKLKLHCTNEPSWMLDKFKLDELKE